MTTPLRTLRIARALLDEPSAWVQHTAAKDAQRAPTSPESLDACCWCITGALIYAVASQVPEPSEHGFERSRLCDSALSALLPALHSQHGWPKRTRREAAGVQLMAFNDSPYTTHGDVLAVLDQSIARIEADETDREL